MSFDIGEGSGEAPSTIEVVEGQPFELPSYTGERPGYVNKGWLYNGVIYQAGDTLYMGKKDITLMIRWVMVHHVTYDLNGGEGEIPVQADVAEGDQFTVMGCTAVKPKHHFAGWEYDSSVYDIGGIITMGTKDITLVAVWEDGNPTHTVTYDINGGSGDAPVQADVEEGSSFAIKYYSGSKEGYRFEGWAYGDSVYQTGDRVTMDGSDIVLTAVWKEWHDTNLSMAMVFTTVTIFELALMGVALYYFVFRRKL